MLPEIACFMGYDYCPRLKKNGPDTLFKDVLPGYMNALKARKVREYITSMFHQFKEVNGPTHMTAETYREQFVCARNLFHHAPILCKK